MAIHRTSAVVIGRRALGENDRLVDFYTRAYGRVRGVAKSARRPRSRFGSALELFTLGELVFFDSGRSELVRIDHFDIADGFVPVREHLERLGQAAWAVECVSRLSGDRDPQPALFDLIVRDLRALAVARRPAWVSVCFALRAVDLLGHRPRIDQCLGCRRLYPFANASLDVEAGGLVCDQCAVGRDAIPVSGAAMGAVRRLRHLKWEDGLRLTLAADLEQELVEVVEGWVGRLAGQPARSTRFIGQLRRSLARVAEPPARWR